MSETFRRLLFFPNGAKEGIQPFALRYKLNDYPSMCGTILVKDLNSSLLPKQGDSYVIKDYSDRFVTSDIELRHEVYKYMFNRIGLDPKCTSKGLVLCGDRNREKLDYPKGFDKEECAISLDEFMRVNEFHRGPEIRNPNHPSSVHMISIGSRGLVKKVRTSEYFKGWTIVEKRDTTGLFNEDGSLVKQAGEKPAKPVGMDQETYDRILRQRSGANYGAGVLGCFIR